MADLNGDAPRLRSNLSDVLRRVQDETPCREPLTAEVALSRQMYIESLRSEP